MTPWQTDEACVESRAAIYPRCEPKVSCQTCGLAAHDPFYRFVRVSIDEEKPCPCPCHRQNALDEYARAVAVAVLNQVDCLEYQHYTVGGEESMCMKHRMLAELGGADG